MELSEEELELRYQVSWLMHRCSLITHVLLKVVL